MIAALNVSRVWVDGGHARGVCMDYSLILPPSHHDRSVPDPFDLLPQQHGTEQRRETLGQVINVQENVRSLTFAIAPVPRRHGSTVPLCLPARLSACRVQLMIGKRALTWGGGHSTAR